MLDDDPAPVMQVAEHVGGFGNPLLNQPETTVEPVFLDEPVIEVVENVGGFGNPLLNQTEATVEPVTLPNWGLNTTNVTNTTSANTTDDNPIVGILSSYFSSLLNEEL